MKLHQLLLEVNGRNNEGLLGGNSLPIRNTYFCIGSSRVKVAKKLYKFTKFSKILPF